RWARVNSDPDLAEKIMMSLVSCLKRAFLGLILFAAATSLSWASQLFDYQALKTLILDNKITSIEDLLASPLFPAEYLENFLLMYSSREVATQAASPLKPRALLYGTGESGLVIGFNGDPAKAGFLDLEIMQFDANTAKFDFKIIEFR